MKSRNSLKKGEKGRKKRREPVFLKQLNKTCTYKLSVIISVIIKRMFGFAERS